MQNSSTVFNNHPCARLLRRIMLGATLTAAIAALVVLGDNGIPTATQAVPVESANEPAANCEGYVNGMPETEEEVAAPPRLPEMALRIRRPQTNAPPVDTNAFGIGLTNVPKGGARIPNFCSASGSCTNQNVAVSFTFQWCCNSGEACFVKVGGGWLSLSRWLQFNAGACLVKVGCKRV